MSSSDRMSRAYESAEEISVGDRSRIVIMSDCHRGDGSWADTFAGNRNLFLAALDDYDRKGFTYIELGDGDELWENGGFAEIMSEYGDIFRVMARFHLEGRLYLIYGNHDMVKRIPGGNGNPLLSNKEFSRLFPRIGFPEGLILNYLGSRIFLTHGHQADFLNSRLWRLSRFLVRNLWRRLESLGVKDPTSASKNPRKKTAVERALMKWAKDKNVMLIAGHTHRAVFPAPGKGLYFNDGSCVNRDYISAIEIEGGNISLVKWSFKVREGGAVYAGRDVRSSAKLRDYLNLNSV